MRAPLLAALASVPLALAACGSKPAPAPESASAPAAETAPASASAPASAPAPAPESAPAPPLASAPAPAASAPPPVPTGGDVYVGDINAPKGFNPRPTIAGMKGQLVSCYNEARAGKPSLRGKVTLHVQVNEAGAVNSVDADPGGNAYDPALVACIQDAMKASAHFPKPGGMATVNVPLLFKP